MPSPFYPHPPFYPLSIPFLSLSRFIPIPFLSLFYPYPFLHNHKYKRSSEVLLFFIITFMARLIVLIFLYLTGSRVKIVFD